MPPRKDTAQAQQDASSEGIDSFELPKSLVTRIAKSALPNDAKLQKETVGALVKGSTVFINYLAATAQDVASSRSHKTIAGADVLKALEIIEFGDLVPLLEGELDVYRGGGKTDKGKAKATAIDVDVKGKGKEKAVPLTTTSGAAQVPLAAPHSDIEPDDADERPIIRDADAPPENEEEAFEDEEMADAELEEEEDVEDDDADEPEVVVDTLAIEADELKQDQRGLEEAGVKDGV